MYYWKNFNDWLYQEALVTHWSYFVSAAYLYPEINSGRTVTFGYFTSQP